MKKLIIILLTLFAAGVYANSNYETGNFHYEGSFNSRSVDVLYTDLSTENLDVIYHNDSSIKVVVYGHTTYDRVEEFLDLGVDSHNFFIESKVKGLNLIFEKYSIKIDVYIPDNSFNIFDLSTSTGDIKCDEFLDLQELKVNTSTGDIFIEGVEADEVSMISSTGEKEIGEILCDDLLIKSSTGDNRLGIIRCDRGKINSSTGELYVRGSNGNLFINSSTGDIDIDQHEKGDVFVDTSTGEVRIGLDSGIGYSVDLNTSTGDITTDLPLEIKGPFDEDKVKGSINDGGFKINVDTSTGDITIY